MDSLKNKPNKFVGYELLPSENRNIADLLELRFIENNCGLHVIFEDSPITLDWH